MEEQPIDNPPTVLHSIFFAGALSVFGLAVALTELGSEWTTAATTIGITAAVVFSAVVIISFFLFKAAKLRVVAVLVALITLAPLAAWSQKPFRRQLFETFTNVLPVIALSNAVKNDFLNVDGICKRVSALKDGSQKLLAISEQSPEVAKICSSEIARTPKGKLALLAKTENDEAFCDFITRLDSLDSILNRLLIRGKISVASQRCLSAEIDKQYETDDALIAMLDGQKTDELVRLIGESRYSKTSVRLSSDAVGLWLFQDGCANEDPDILAFVGITDECPTMMVESGWPNICELSGTETKMETVCRLTRKFTLGMSINEAKRIVHRAIRKFQDQIEADSIAQYDSTSYSAVSMDGRGRGGGGGGYDRQRLENSGLLGLAKGRIALGSRNAALMPSGVSGLVSNLQGFEMPTHSQDEWNEMRENVFKQMLSGDFDDSRIAGFLESQGMTELLPKGQSLKELFEAHGETLSPQQAKTLEKNYAKFKKNQTETGANKLTKNAPKKPKERVKKKRDRDIKAQPTLGN